MTKYHGTPCSPMKVFYEAFTGRNVLIPFPRPDDMKRAIEVADKIILDNGAFSIWRKGGTPNWEQFYKWVDNHVDNVEFFFIPDVIDGTEKENDDLIQDFLDRYKYQQGGGQQLNKGVPIWHVNESLDRLERLAYKYDYIAFGSAGEYAQLGTEKWHSKMDEAMSVVCDKQGKPRVKIHMLRCLDPRLFTKYPFHSGDSTNVAMNHNRKGWQPIMKRIEAHESPKTYSRRQATSLWSS